MPSILAQYASVDFIAGRPFVYAGTKYEIGEDVPDAKSFGNLESLVRSRFLVPVVPDHQSKPFEFHREVKTRELARRKLGLDPGTDSTDPQPGDRPLEVENGEFDPGEHTVSEVLTYVDEYPDQLLSVYAQEEEGKHRSTLLARLDDRLNEQADKEGTENV